jgi:5'-nucleotidase
VNIPKGHDIKGIRVCRQTAGKWVDEFMPAKDGANKQVYWLTGVFENDEPHDETTDEWALAHGYVSVVPVKVDMTNHEQLERMKGWEELI